MLLVVSLLHVIAVKSDAAEPTRAVYPLVGVMDMLHT
jgi:hypothetical protein